MDAVLAPGLPRLAAGRALSSQEREAVLDVLRSPRFVDCAPAQVWATLLDEGRYLASERTFYRLLAARHGGVRERRDQLVHPPYERPELLAERPNELWSWDVSKLKGPAKWTVFYLYVILDVFSRYAVGWTVAHRESSQLAKALIGQRARRGCPRRAPARSGGRLRCDARAVRPPGAPTAQAADRRVDQQAGRHRGGRSLNSRPICLTELDRLRPTCVR